MEKLLLKEAMNLYVEKLNDDSFADSQVVTDIKTTKEIMREVNSFKIKCKVISSNDIDYPKEYSELEIRMIYCGLFYLKEVLDEKCKELNNKLKIYSYDENIANDTVKVNNLMEELEREMDKRILCNKLQLEFLNLYFKK